MFVRRLRIACRLGAALLFAAVGGGHPAAGQDTPAPPQARELIVKFKAGSDGDRIAAQAMQDQSRQAAMFADLAASLANEIGMPVRIAAVTSGRELVMSVDAAALTSAVIAGLEERADVVRAMSVESEAPQVTPRNPVIIVEFADDSAIARALAAGGAERLADDADIQALQDDVARQAGGQLTLLPNAAGFMLEVGQLTVDLGARLQQRTDVEYVQPNVLVQPLPQ